MAGTEPKTKDRGHNNLAKGIDTPFQTLITVAASCKLEPVVHAATAFIFGTVVPPPPAKTANP